LQKREETLVGGLYRCCLSLFKNVKRIRVTGRRGKVYLSLSTGKKRLTKKKEKNWIQGESVERSKK